MIVGPECLSLLDVPFLRLLIATDQKQYDLKAFQTIIDSIAWSEVKSQFMSALSYRLSVSKMAQSNPVQAHIDPDLSLNIQILKPVVKWAITP